MWKAEHLPEYWHKPLAVLLALLVVFVWFFADSWLSVMSIWQRSDTYAHGFLVAPASLWLLWGRKALLKQIHPKPSFWGLLGLLGSGFVWLAAVLSKVLVVEQFALVAGLVSLIWLVLGNQFMRNMLFPLLFLFLMVPFGEDFVPLLMEYTASFTVAMLRLTGISVYREGLHFFLTSGQWSVVEACSGIRYLIASFTLGLIYAYINYTKHWKRAIFIVLSVLVPILANGLRAYMIVMIGHLSGMKLATGVDHIIYGWLFFGLVMLILFYVGSFWQDQAITDLVGTQQRSNSSLPSTAYVYVAVIGLFSTGIWPLAAHELLARQAIPALIPASFLQNASESVQPGPDWGWQPKFNGVRAEALQFVLEGEQPVGIYVANFGDESEGGELINSRNTLIYSGDKRWRISRSANTEIAFADQAFLVEEATLINNRAELLVFRWYRIGETNTANAYYAKWLQLSKRLTGDASPELMVVLFTEINRGDRQQAAERLHNVAEACCG